MTTRNPSHNLKTLDLIYGALVRIFDTWEEHPNATGLWHRGFYV